MGKRTDNTEEVVERLESLELRVTKLQSLLQKLVEWTKFQDEVTQDHDNCEGSDVSHIKEENKDKNKGVTKGRKRVGPKRRIVNKCVRDTSPLVRDVPVDSDYIVPSTSKTLLKSTGPVAKKSTSGIPRLKITSVSSKHPDLTTIADEITVKEEPPDFGDFLVVYPSQSPTRSLSDASFAFETAEETQNHSDAEFSPSSEEDEEIQSEDEGVDEVGDSSTKKSSTGKRKRLNNGDKKSSSGVEKKPKKRRIYKYRGTKLFVLPLDPKIKPPFVSLSKIDGATLKEKYGIEEPRPRPTEWSCPVCAEVFPSKRNMEIHRKTHPRVYKRYTCSFCGKTNVSKSKHHDHVNTHTGERPYLCDICGYAGASKNILRSHTKMVHLETERKFQCDICSCMLKNKNSLKVHQKLLHSEPGTLQELPCDICGVKFKSDDKLKRHKKEIHVTARRFQCPMCEKSFKRPQHLAAHKERHKTGLQRNRGLKEEYDKKKNPVGQTEKETDCAFDSDDADVEDPLNIDEGHTNSDKYYPDQETQQQGLDDPTATVCYETPTNHPSYVLVTLPTPAPINYAIKDDQDQKPI